MDQAGLGLRVGCVWGLRGPCGVCGVREVCIGRVWGLRGCVQGPRGALRGLDEGAWPCRAHGPTLQSAPRRPDQMRSRRVAGQGPGLDGGTEGPAAPDSVLCDLDRLDEPLMWK